MGEDFHDCTLFNSAQPSGHGNPGYLACDGAGVRSTDARATVKPTCIAPDGIPAARSTSGGNTGTQPAAAAHHSARAARHSQCRSGDPAARRPGTTISGTAGPAADSAS